MLKKALGAASALAISTVFMAPTTASAAPALTYTPVAQWWGTNGRVMDIVAEGGRVYLAGGFDYIGPTTGYGVGVDGGTGAKLPGAPLVNGPVYAAVPDGSGGWYIAGDFTYVGDSYRRAAARIDADGNLRGWNPKPNGPVYALAVSGGSVVMGGDFTTLGTTAVTATRIGSVDGTSGSPTPGWSATASAAVRSLLANGASIYAAGDFTSVNGASRAGLVRLSAATGATDSTFPGRTTGAVKALAMSADGSTLYVGGDLTAASNGSTSSSRSRLAAFDTGSGAPTSWAPATDGTVLALAGDPANGTVYAGGTFATVNGASRVRLAGITAGGSVTSFDAILNGCHVEHGTKDAHSNPTCTPEVDSLAVSSSTLYVGGRFGASSSTSRHDAAAFVLADGSLTSWNPIASDRVLALAPTAGSVFVGGVMTSVNGLVRKGLAALNASTGEGDPSFMADTDDEVLDLEPSPDGSRLFLGGHFVTVRGISRKYAAAVSTVDGTVDPTFKANANNDVLTLGYAAGVLYASGQFTKLNGIAKSHAAKLSPTTGAVDTAFTADTVGPTGNLRAGGMVQGMAVAPDGSKVYLGGPFQTVNGTSRPGGIAVVNGATGALLPNQLGGVEGCGGIGPWINHLYLSADGSRLYGGDVCPDRIYQWDAKNLSSASRPTGLLWKSWCNAGMQGALEVNGTFYYGSHGGDKGRGGYCWNSPTLRQSVARQRYAAFNATTGVLLSDAPQFDSPMGVFSFAVIPQGLLVGGDFRAVGPISPSSVHQGLVLFPGTP